MASTGTMNPRGTLHAGLSLAGTLLKPHVVLMESINSLLKRVVGDAPNISLELLSARVSLKKQLGFHVGEVNVGGVPGLLQEQVVKNANPWKSPKVQSKLMTAQPRLMEGKSFKHIRPFAMMLSDLLLPCIGDASLFVQRMDRWACPSPVKNLPSANLLTLNYDDRPFASLPYSRRRDIGIASSFHKQWFDHHRSYIGSLNMIAFCLDNRCGTRLRAKTTLLDAEQKVFLVGEVHSRQASIWEGWGWNGIV